MWFAVLLHGGSGGRFCFVFKITADIVFGRDPVHNNAFSFVKVYIFTRFGLAFTLKRSNGGLGSKKKKVFRKQRFIVLMRSGKKEDSQKR